MREPDYSILSKLRSPISNSPRRKSIAGKHYGQWTIFGLVGYHHKTGIGHWLCRCSCGNWGIINRNALNRRRSKSCGCKSAVQRTHGMRKTATYCCFTNMLTRSRNSNFPQRKDYAGRGIKVCHGLQSFENYFAILGSVPANKSTDRIDNNGNYSCGKCRDCLANNWPMNVKWSTSKEQNRNRRDNLLVTIGQETKCLAEWVEMSGVLYSTARLRLKRGGTPEHALGF